MKLKFLKSTKPKPANGGQSPASARGTGRRWTGRGALPVLALLLLGARAVVAAPAITGLYPPVLNEHAGDHVAFTVKATGSGTLQYQWYFNGTALANQTSASVVITNIQPANSGQYGVTVVDSSATSASNSAALNVSSTYLPLYPTNLVVARLGDGVQTLSAATGNTIYLDQYTTNGVYVSTVQIPDEVAGQTYGTGSSKTPVGSPSVILPGAGSDAINQGALTLSGNQQFITLAGYQLAWPYTGSDVTAGGATYVRGIYDVNAYGYPTLAYTNYGLYSGGNHTIRSAVTLDGTNFWTTGQAGSVGGVKAVSATNTAYATGSGIPTISSSTMGSRVVQIANGNLVFSDAAATGGHGLWAANGLPQPPAGAAGSTATSLVLNEGGLPNDFAISPDGQTVYIADGLPYGGSTVQAGGIERWDYSTSSSSYAFSYTLPTTTGTNGAQNLAVIFPANITAWGPGVTGAVVYATLPLAATNSIVSVVDNGASSTPVTVVTAGPNQVLRGVRFGPSAVGGLSIASNPTNYTAFVGNNATFAVVAQGAGPFSYQWQFNNVNIANATQATLTVTNVQVANGGSYSVVVSNPGGSVTSSAAVLTVVLGKPVITANPQSWVETAGDHVAFGVAAAGTLPISYQWYLNSAAIPGATNSGLVLADIQPANAGTYYVVATNIYGSATSKTATLSVTTTPQSLSSNNLVVARIGDGSQVLSGATGNTIYLDQYTTNGTYVSSIQIPDQGLGAPYGYGSGTNKSTSANLPVGSVPLIVAGAGPDAGYEGLLTLSADTASLNFAGYVQAWPANVPDVTYSDGNNSDTWRGVGGISTYGYYTLDYTNSGLYSAGNHTIHSATTVESVNFWSAGQAGTSGIKFFNALNPAYANGLGIPVITSSGPGSRVVQILNGNLAFTDASGASGPGIYASSGTPEPGPSGTGSASLIINEGGSPVDFAASPDGQTIYITDDQPFGGATVQAGGIQRWDSNGAGGYNYSYTLGTGTNLVGARGLTVYFPPAITTWGPGVTGAILYATTTESINNRVVRVTDAGAGSAAVTLATSGANQLYTGLRFGPSLVPVALYNNPVATNVFAGQSASFTATPTGTRPYAYQWQLNGTNLVGATNAVLTLSNLQTNSAGGYSVVVNNGAGATTSAAAQLTVVSLPVFTGTTNLAGGQGFQLSFTGPAGYGYSLWTSSNLALKPVTNAWTQLETGNAFSGGTDTFVDSNGVANSNQFYIITIP